MNSRLCKQIVDSYSECPYPDTSKDMLYKFIAFRLTANQAVAIILYAKQNSHVCMCDMREVLLDTLPHCFKLREFDSNTLQNFTPIPGIWY